MKKYKNKKTNYWKVFYSIKKYKPNWSDKRLHYLLHTKVIWE